MSNIVPTIDDLDTHPVSLSVWELQVLDTLLALDNEWTVYVKPMIAWHQPSFIAAHPRHGVCVIEAKGWAVGSRRVAANGVMEHHDGTQWLPTADEPCHQVDLAKRAVAMQFFGGIDRIDPTLVRGVVIMTQYSTNDACSLLRGAQGSDAKNRIKVWGGHALADDPLCVLTGHPRPAHHDVSPLALQRLHRHCLQHDRFAG